MTNESIAIPADIFDDVLRFRVQATTIEPRSDAHLQVSVAMLVKSTETDQDSVESSVAAALKDFVDTTWVFLSLRREADTAGFERVNLDAVARVPTSELHNLRHRVRQASRDGIDLGTPTVSYRLPEERINVLQSGLRLKVIEEIKRQQAILEQATGRSWRIGGVDFGIKKLDSEDGEHRISKGGYRAAASEMFEGGGMAGAERFTLVAEVTLKSRPTL